ncbi:RNA polymerase sigma factor [Filobacillus milosensis]|uniref:RNA polymerase sigma factor n=1 Tax=Filobacillus milosensis TaxID=94137 RepID=A0A4Y8INZ9_9BACI|nr:RNA polymerase sigma factor [Filobacillus milosensis]TFB21357.1 RNA polymerase sigma factor [Filobacillus milosensis]
MFEETISQYQTDLSNYCRMLTGTPWDAEDLYQETLLKTYHNKDKLLNHPNPKAYLLKVASTTWIDICRKNKVVLDSIEGIERLSAEGEEEDAIIVEEMIEEFSASLHPKQAVTILLVDVFKYTAKETAEMIDTTTGAVKSLLHRGRGNLAKKKKVKDEMRSPNELIDAFKKAITLNDPSIISAAYKSVCRAGMDVQYLKENKSFMLYDPEGNVIGIINR